MEKIALWSAGGAEEVTGSKHVLDVNGQRILVDCGQFQGRREETYEKNQRFPFDPKSVEAVLLTHGHFDHCGNLPSLVKQGFDGNIYSTRSTQELSALVLTDSSHLQQKDADFVATIIKKKKRADMKVYPPLYNAEDVKETLRHFVTYDYERRFRVGQKLNVEFFDAGHILGSAMVMVTVNREDGTAVRIGFSGDLGRKATPLLKNPRHMPPVDYFIVESTYGNRLHEDVDQAETELAEVITSTAAKGGKVIIPAFAIERTQVLLYFIHKLRNANRIPRIPVYVDSPMAISATSIFKAHPECFDRETYELFFDHDRNPFEFPEVRYVAEVQESMQINERHEPAIIISASGMCEAGRILHHLRNNVENPNNTVLIVGFMAKNTLGRKLADRNPTLTIFGETFELKSRVKIINAFSAHADYREIAEYVSEMDLTRLKKIFLVHGETEARNNLKLELKRIFPNVEPVETEKRYTLE